MMGMSVTVLGGMVAVLVVVALVVALVAALFSGRFWAVLAGVAGTLLLAVGGLLLVSALIFVKRSARPVERISLPDGGSVMVRGTKPPDSLVPPGSLVVEAPEPSADNAFASSADAESAIKKTDPQPTGAPRPAWMDGQMGRVGDVYRTTVKVGPAFSRTECEKQLPMMMQEAVQTYADHLLGAQRGQFVHLPAAYIQNHLVHGEWEEQRETTYETMITLHQLLEFDREANEAIEANYRQAVVMGRLAYTAAGGGLVFGLLTILFGYLRLDTLTRGSYTGRLRLTATAAILALAAVAGLLVIA